VADLVSGLLGILMATNQTVAASNFVAERTGVKVPVINTNDPVAREYLQLLQMDNAAQADIESWIQENDKFAAKGAGTDDGSFRAKTRARLEPVDKAYRDFLERNPKHTDARVAYASFLSDTGRDDDAKTQLETARNIDPQQPAVWNNLANYYGHNGPLTNAFACYEKAIELNPTASVYYQNLATTVYLFRQEATNYYRITEQQVFDKAMALYRKALTLEPDNFPLATDVAQTYYGIKPPRAKDALEAWNHALKLARDDIEREGVHLHLARWQKTAGNVEAARRELSFVTNAMYSTTRSNVLRTIEKQERGTNAPAGAETGATAAK
jgi:tetratricopeptide (TPR) repeat protein